MKRESPFVPVQKSGSGGDACKGQLLHSDHHELLLERFHLAQSPRVVQVDGMNGVSAGEDSKFYTHFVR